MAVFQTLPGNKLIHTFLHSSALVRDSFPSGFDKIEHQKKYFSHFPAVVKAFFLLKKKTNQNLLTPFHYSVFNFNIFSPNEAFGFEDPTVLSNSLSSCLDAIQVLRKSQRDKTYCSEEAVSVGCPSQKSGSCSKGI